MVVKAQKPSFSVPNKKFNEFYVQKSVGKQSRIKPKKEDWKLSYVPVRKTLDLLNPDDIVVFGYRMWDKIWRRFDYIDIIKTHFNTSRNAHILKSGNQPLFFSIQLQAQEFLVKDSGLLF